MSDTGSSPNSKANTEHLAPYQFKPGESGNPKGRVPDPPELKQAKLMTKQYMKEIGSLVVMGSIDELEKIAKDKTQPAIKMWIAAVAVKGMNKGDMEALDKLLNRLIGKVKDEVELSGQVTKVVRLRLPDNGREAK